MKLIAITLAALFLSTSAVPAEAARKSNPGVSYTLLSTIPGLNGCC